MHEFTLAFLVALTLSLVTHVWLSVRQLKHVREGATSVPAQFDGRISLAAHQRAAAYTLDRTRLGIADTVFSHLLAVVWTLGGGIAWLSALWAGSALGEPWQGAGLIMSVMLIGALLSLPMDLWSTFVTEQRHGFNRTTARTFMVDLLKKLALTVVIGLPLAAVMIWIMESLGSNWWIAAFVVWLGINLLAVWAFPILIAPLFNRFEPLRDESLAGRIGALLGRHGFQVSGIFVADGSRRSGHGNAYFTGLGASKRIVFYDTLLESLDGDEVEAVLAHEVGHFKHRHIPKQLLVNALIVMAALALLAWLAEQNWFYTSLGVPEPGTAAALLLFLITAPVFFFFMSPAFGALSRKHEFEADAFAAGNADGASLVSALVKLYRENASTLTPDPLYSAFHDSHPPAPLRVARLESTN